MRVLVTGSAGFIGHHLALALVRRGHSVVGLDNLNDYYDPRLKLARLRHAGFDTEHLRRGELVASASSPEHRFVRLDVNERGGSALVELMQREGFDCMAHLAAQAGVRHSLTHPHDYVRSNLEGFVNVLQACREVQLGHLAYASSSSVYGLNSAIPFATHHNVDHAVSLYAATKKSNELMAHAYSHLFALPTTGMRFFTVYGPWGRPDMALFRFVRAMLADEPVPVFNRGNMQRDFTYVDDVVSCVARILERPPEPDPSWDASAPDPSRSSAPYRVYNIGNSRPVALMDFVRTIERCLGRSARIRLEPMQPGDVERTWADVGPLQEELGYRPDTSIEEGVGRFVRWYLRYYGESSESGGSSSPS